MPYHPTSTPAADRHSQRFAELRQQLQNLDYFCKGTVLARRMKCGQPSCVCRREPSQRHGPYWEWTYKLRGKTVNVRLSSEAGPIYQAAAGQYRKLKSLLARLERASRSGLAARAKRANPKPPH